MRVAHSVAAHIWLRVGLVLDRWGVRVEAVQVALRGLSGDEVFTMLQRLHPAWMVQTRVVFLAHLPLQVAGNTRMSSPTVV